MTALTSRPWRWAAVAVPLGLIVLAAVLRLPSLSTRATWDADQGHDMLVLRALVRDGIVPLLGPPTSIGDVHHGALYYYLLAPAAALTGGDSPLAVTALIALGGITAVLVTWWLARSIAGPVAGLVAGLAMAVSASAVEESTFIWNPNLIALSSAIALAGAWQAWSTRRPRWWLLAAAGTAITLQSHVLGIALLPMVGALLVADARARFPGGKRRRVWRYGLAGLAIVAATFLPLAIHELQSDFSEIHAALEYLRAGGDPTALGPLARFLVIGARVASWPVTGLITDGPLAGLTATIVVIAIAVWRALAGSLPERVAARWLGLGLLWTAGFLALASPSLATVVPGLPNDHYHAFADPMVFVLVGMGAAGLWRLNVAATAGGDVGAAAGGDVGAAAGGDVGAAAGGDVGTGGARQLPVHRVAVVAAVAILVSWNIGHQPPAIAPDGGFPAAERAAIRIVDSARQFSAAGGSGSGRVTLRSIPDFKSVEAYAYPLIRLGVPVNVDRGEDNTRPATRSMASLVLICDAIFEAVVGASCGGPAEAVVAPPATFGDPIERFEAAPGRTISIYRPQP